MTRGNGLRVLVAAESGVVRLVEESLLTALPTASVAAIAPGAITGRQLPPALCAIVGPRFGELTQVEVVRALRAASFGGSIVLVATEPLTDETLTSARRFGVAEIVSLDSLPSRLPPAVLAAASAPDDSVAARELRETQRLIAAGEIALGLQHSLNNPLAALLAEAQLLELEPLPEEHHQAVQRMVELCRRLAGIVRRLDGVTPNRLEMTLPGDPSGSERARTSQK